MIEPSAKGLAIDIQGLAKSFGRTSVLRNLDLKVPWGEVLTVIGPNGCGKTTLIKILATLTKHDTGAVLVAGHDVALVGERVRGIIGVVTHAPFLYDDLTGFENLKFFAGMFGLDNIGERIQEVVERMGVGEGLNHRASTMSHGTKKRFSIARALLHDPLVLLLDEPESGLDQEALEMMQKILTDRTKRLQSVLMTTHNLERGMTLGSHLAVLAQGKIVYKESLDSVDVSSLRAAYLQYTGVST